MKIDFKILTPEAFEFLCEEILKAKGLIIRSRPARGPDGGKDIIAIKEFQDDMGVFHKEKWLVECKHLAVSDRSVREADIGNVEARMRVHNTNRYLLITSTVVSETVKNQIEAFTKNTSGGWAATFWIKYDIIRILEVNPDIARRYAVDMEAQAFKVISMINKHHDTAHRGALLWYPDIVAIFENRVGRASAVDINELRGRLSDRNIEELAYCQSSSSETWVMLVSSPLVKDLNDLVWELCNGDIRSIAQEKKIAHLEIYKFHYEPINTK